MAISPFIHLHVHSSYSLLSSTLRVDKLVAQAKAFEMPAVALTDQGNLFAAIQFYSLCLKSGIKPILGAQVYVVADRNNKSIRSDKEERDQLILLCRDGEGWKNLMRIVSIGHLEGSHGKPRVDFTVLEKHKQGLIALSGGMQGAVGRLLRENRVAEAEESARSLAHLFHDGQANFFIEVERHGLPWEEAWLQASVELAQRLDIPLVASGDVHFMVPGDLRARDALFCIGAGRTLMDPERPQINEQYAFYSGQQMAERFSDLPEAVANTHLIAKRCNVRLQLGRPVLPDFKLPAGQNLSSWLRKEAEEGLKLRLQRHILPRFPVAEHSSIEQQYRERLDFELDVILQMGFPGYFLIVSDFIRWAKDNGVPVGPGRGSGAGSLAAYALQITDLDPIRFQLLFERFLNPERVSMPDFDVDFCMDRRDRVIDYVQERYGRDRVAGIITYGTLQARAVVRDVARVLEFSYSQADRIAKLIPNILGITLEKAIQEEERLQNAIKEDQQVGELMELARSLEGLPRSAGTHAAGIVIANGPLTDMVPLYLDPRSTMPVTQFYMGDAEKAGLVKFDFLGLKTLTVIQDAVDRVNVANQAQGQPLLDISTLDLDDRETYNLLKDGKTLGVFQLESSGMREILRKLAPDTFEDIIALVALYRPGPLGSGMVDDFINGKHGRIQVEYPLPQLEPILKETYGVILYQEQVMQIAQVLSGYTLGGADLLRRAMGKKKPQEMAAQRAIFMDGAGRNEIDVDKATHIFDLMEKFAGYGFNKSHSAAYALISYQTAWLKAHYPLEFMAATLTCEMINTDKVMRFIRECRAMGLRVHPPDVNQSDVFFASRDQGIWYGLAAIKNVGEAAMAALVKTRQEGGPFASLHDLCRRLGSNHLNKRVMENLIKSGACDNLGGHRAALMAALPEAMSQGIRRQDEKAKGFRSLFAEEEEEETANTTAAALLPDVPEWSDAEQLALEKEALGFYLTSHPLRKYEEELSGYGLETTRALWDRYGGGRDGGGGGGNDEEEGETERWVPPRYEEPPPHRGRKQDENRIKVVVAGIVAERKLHRTRKGERMAFFTLEDRHGQVESVAFPESYNAGRDLLEREDPVVVEGTVEENSDDLKILVDAITDLDGYRAKACGILHVEMDASILNREVVGKLESILAPHQGGECRVLVTLRFANSRALLRLGEHFHVFPRERLLIALQELAGKQRVKFFKDRYKFNEANHWSSEF